MKAIAEITKDCLNLPSSQRLELARILLDVSESESDFSSESETAWEEKIALRMHAVINGTASSRPIEDVLAELAPCDPV